MIDPKIATYEITEVKLVERTTYTAYGLVGKLRHSHDTGKRSAWMTGLFVTFASLITGLTVAFFGLILKNMIFDLAIYRFSNVAEAGTALFLLFTFIYLPSVILWAIWIAPSDHWVFKEDD